jgi:hypothetical protein
LNLSVGNGTFILVNKNGYQTTFSDFAGPVSGYFLSYKVGSYTQEWSTTYETFGIGVGLGISLPEKINGGVFKGVTTYLGEPYFDPNPDTD